VEGNTVLVSFDQINGHLTHRGRLTGFSIHGADGKPVPLIFRARISPKSPGTVELLFGGKLPENAVLWYGYGKDPYVNLEDSLRMPCPVFTLPVQ